MKLIVFLFIIIKIVHEWTIDKKQFFSNTLEDLIINNNKNMNKRRRPVKELRTLMTNAKENINYSLYTYVLYFMENDKFYLHLSLWLGRHTILYLEPEMVKNFVRVLLRVMTSVGVANVAFYFSRCELFQYSTEDILFLFRSFLKYTYAFIFCKTRCISNRTSFYLYTGHLINNGATSHTWILIWRYSKRCISLSYRIQTYY